MKHFTRLLAATLLLISVTACGDDDTSETTTTVTTAAATTTSQATTTEAPTTGDRADVIDVTFDGGACTVVGPTEVPAGDRVFIFKDLSDLYTDFNLEAFADDMTYQDLVDLQNQAGGPGATFDFPEGGSSPLYSFAPLEISLADDELAHRYDLEPGEHGIYLWSTDPSAFWLCGPLVVTNV